MRGNTEATLVDLCPRWMHATNGEAVSRRRMQPCDVAFSMFYALRTKGVVEYNSKSAVETFRVRVAFEYMRLSGAKRGVCWTG